MTTESRSSISFENLQESLDSGGKGSLEQYESPIELARELMGYLPTQRPATLFDPQAASGNLLRCHDNWANRFGIEIDDKKDPGGLQILHANCARVFVTIDELLPDLRFVVGNANPPFGLAWKDAEGRKVDSTLMTWNFIVRHANMGFFIANANTIEKFGIHEDKRVRIIKYERRQALRYWKGLRPELEIGIVIWQRADGDTRFTPASVVSSFWEKLQAIFKEERSRRPDFNVFLDQRGILKTYLSQRTQYKYKLTPPQIARLSRINDCYPLTLTTEKETRMLLRELIDGGIYTLQPAAKQAMEAALAEVNAIACPIMPVTEFETVSYAEEEDSLVCIRGATEINGVPVALTVGKSYNIRTASYHFTESFQRNKVHFDEETKQTYTAVHDCTLSGTDRYIALTDDHGREIKFMDRPRKQFKLELEEKELWHYFKKPVVHTVGEVSRELVNQNHAVLKACEMLAGYTYYEGQLNYLARVGVKDYAMIAASTGVGKTLMAISMIAMKSPQRALIIAPQGTMRASKVEDEDEDEDDDTSASMSASQWLKELNKFAPYLQVFEIFSHEDYQNLLNLNNGKLPYGVYVTYFEAFFSNGAKERAPQSWDDEKLNKYLKAKGLAELELDNGYDKHHYCDTVGKEVQGVRCIIEPCLSTLIGHHFDCVLVDESHKAKGLDSTLTQMLIRLQPRFRYCLSATPVANTVSDLFPIIGWLAVPGWYKGGRRNAAFPFAREEISRFNTTFMTQERDHTKEEMARSKDPKWRGRCVQDSPIISNPAWLLKILKPTMAFISKEECRADYIPPKIIDVRVPMGKEQAVLYGHFTNRANIHASNALVRARKQTAYLRNICSDPAGFAHGGPKVWSNMNPKVVAILELARDILARGEQVVIINSRVGLTSTIANKLIEAGVPCARIDSTVEAEQHAYQANVFKSKRAKVLFMGIKSAAAYSFDDCENLIIGSLEYSSGTFTQACGRIDRVTNKTVKNIYCILHKHSIEEVQYEIVSLKGDAANLCLRGKRIPREFRPVDSSEILAKALDRFDLSGAPPEVDCERQWPKLLNAIKQVTLK
jgi:predicted RNA methylase